MKIILHISLNVHIALGYKTVITHFSFFLRKKKVYFLNILFPPVLTSSSSSYLIVCLSHVIVLLYAERPEGAERCYRRALSIKPDHINANTNMGHLCRLQHRWGEASRYYRVALSRRPDNPTLLYNLGVVLERIGHPSNVTVKAVC